MCCFDKTGTITAEDLVLEGLVGIEYVVPLEMHFILILCSPYNPKRLVEVSKVGRETTLCLATAHALVRLDDGTIVGDPMEKTTLEALEWTLQKGMVSEAQSQSVNTKYL